MARLLNTCLKNNNKLDITNLKSDKSIDTRIVQMPIKSDTNFASIDFSTKISPLNP